MSNKVLKNWWEEPNKINELIRWMAGKGYLKEVSEVIDLQEHPEKYTKEYYAYLEDKESQYQFEKKHTQEFFDERFYPINGDWYESLTTILWAYPSPWLTKLIGDYGTVEVELRKKIKGERGSRVHDALQKNAVVKRKDFEDEEWLCLIHAKEFLDEYKPKMIFNEEWCWSVKHHFATRLDRIVEIDGKIVLIDWKTGFVGDEAWLQLAGTKLCAEETFPIKIDDYGIVQLNAPVKRGWRFLPISEREDVLAEIERTNDLKQAIQNAYERDCFVLHSLHEVWKHCFRKIKPKRYPMDIVPDELVLAIENVLKRDEFVKLAVEKNYEVETIEKEEIKEGESDTPKTQANNTTIEKSKPTAEDSPSPPLKENKGIDIFKQLLDEVNNILTEEGLNNWLHANEKKLGNLNFDQLKEIQLILQKKGLRHAKRKKQ